MNRREIRHSPTIQRDWQLGDRDDVAFKVAGLGDVVVRPGDALDEGRDDRNGLALLSGDHGRLTPLKQDTVLSGAPGSYSSGVATFSQRTVVKGIEFKDTVDIGATAEVQFIECVFRELVTVESGGKAHFMGCRFLDAAAVDNSAAAAPLNIGVIGCIRKSGVAHQFVTTIFETV